MAPTCTMLLLRLPLRLNQNRVVCKAFYSVSAQYSSPNFPDIVNGNFDALPSKVKEYIIEKQKLCLPDAIHICDGSEAENKEFLLEMQAAGEIKPVPKLDNCWYARTDPRDVARVESKTVIVTDEKSEAIPTPLEGVEGKLGHWMSKSDLNDALGSRFPGCMKGRTMYVLPFSMGPVGGTISKYGIQLTDSKYVCTSMRVMTRVTPKVLDHIEGGDDFVKCLHSVGCPLPLEKELVNNWACNPEQVIVSHIPDNNEIISFGSGYGGNSLLGKKCFALRLGSILGRREGWLAEHMLILGITNPEGKKKYVAAAFPSACGKTNLAMMEPTIPGWKVECVGDDIAWLKFDENGKLRAINPENGFFGVAPGTSMNSNPNAMKACSANTVFTNVAETGDGGVYWEGIGEEPVYPVTSWLGKDWVKESGENSSHPNSRFCCPASQCPTIDENWEKEDGVPIDAIIFGGRRPKGIPLVYEAFNWQHGVFVGGAMRSEATAAAEHKGKVIMHDPFAMRPFFGYNFGKYLEHWLSMDKEGRDIPKVFHVNWFRKDEKGSFMWPGFGENIRVLEWIFNRTESNTASGVKESPIGLLPVDGAINTDGLKEPVDMDKVFELSKDFLETEVSEISRYFEEQVNVDLPQEISEEIDSFKQRISEL